MVATRNVLSFARQVGCPKLIFISSSSVYYIPGDQLNITEDTPFPASPINEYAATKRIAERLVRESGLPSLILRPRAVFGPGDTVLFPRILRAAKRGMLPRFIRADGKSPIGDLIYIENLTHYIARALASFRTGALNLTNAEPVDLYAFLGIVLKGLHLPPIRRRIPLGLGLRLASTLEFVSRTFLNYREPPLTRFGVGVLAWSKTFDISRSIAAFGPPPVSLDQGIGRFIAWQRTQTE